MDAAGLQAQCYAPFPRLQLKARQRDGNADSRTRLCAEFSCSHFLGDSAEENQLAVGYCRDDRSVTV